MTKEQEIEVEGAIGPSHARLTTEARFDLLADPKQSAGRHRSLKANRSIVEDLSRSADGNRSPDAAYRSDLNLWMGVQCLDRQRQLRVTIAQ